MQLMIEDQIRRLQDPRVRRPIVGIAVSYLAWVAMTIVVRMSGLSSGDEVQRWVAVMLLTVPIFGMALFFVRVHSQADEVERAMHAGAAAVGFTFMLLASFVGMVLADLDLRFQLTPTHIWVTGMVAWLLGLIWAFRKYQ